MQIAENEKFDICLRHVAAHVRRRYFNEERAYWPLSNCGVNKNYPGPKFGIKRPEEVKN